MDKELKDIELSGGFEWTPGSPWPPYVGIGITAMDVLKITPQESDDYDIHFVNFDLDLLS